jgi:hypothetical protein
VTLGKLYKGAGFKLVRNVISCDEWLHASGDELIEPFGVFPGYGKLIITAGNLHLKPQRISPF